MHVTADLDADRRADVISEAVGAARVDDDLAGLVGELALDDRERVERSADASTPSPNARPLLPVTISPSVSIRCAVFALELRSRIEPLASSQRSAAPDLAQEPSDTSSNLVTSRRASVR